MQTKLYDPFRDEPLIPYGHSLSTYVYGNHEPFCASEYLVDKSASNKPPPLRTDRLLEIISSDQPICQFSFSFVQKSYPQTESIKMKKTIIHSPIYPQRFTQIHMWIIF